MNRDTFIITVYCLVVTHYHALTAAQPLRHGGFAPDLSDAEVLTMEICGESWKLHTDTDLYAYFRAHYQHFFPKLHDRTLFVRQAAGSWLFSHSKTVRTIDKTPMFENQDIENKEFISKMDKVELG